MFSRLSAVLALSLMVLGSHTVIAAKKKSKPGSGTTTAASRKTSKKAPVRSSRPKTQTSPAPERYKQIQEALTAKGYLPPGQATGQWNDASADALKRFQADQNIESNGRINSLSLIALGLGPKHEPVPAAVPPTAP